MGIDTTFPAVAASYQVKIPLQPEADAVAVFGEHAVALFAVGAAGTVLPEFTVTLPVALQLPAFEATRS